MLEIKFDNVEIDSNGIKGLSNTYELYKDNFYLGAVASNTFKLEVAKHLMPNKPIEVKIEDDNNSYVLEVDKIEETDNSYNIELTDKMLRFNYLYDAKPLIDNNRDAEGNSTTTIQDILEDICDKADVVCNYTLTATNHVVDWWDNRISARDYISMIAEKESSFVRFENDELMFIPVNSPSKRTINEDEVDELKIGERKVISRVIYDGGAFKWEFGDDTGNTLYLGPNNVYIVEEDDVEAIYDSIKDFEFYSITVGNCPIDSSVLAGDIITFKDRDDNLYPTIAQYNLSYFGKWLGGYKLAVNTDRQQETQVIKDKDNIRNLNVKVDRLNNEFSIIAEEVGENKSQITQIVQTVDGFAEKIEKIDGIEERTNTVETTIDGMKQSLTYSGGYNLLENCLKQFGQSGWTGNFINVTNTEIQQNSLTKSALQFMNGTEEREIQVPNGIYNFSARYKKLIELAVCKITINGQEIIFDGTGWQEKELTFEVKSNTISIVFFGDTDISCWIVDLLFIPGDVKQTWTPNPNEINTGTIKAGGDTLSIEATGAKTKFEAKTDGIRIKNTITDDVTTEFTVAGTKTTHLEAKTAVISELSFGRIGNQVVLKVVDR